MTDKDREYYMKKYSHLNLYFGHGRGWDELTLSAAYLLDQSTWPRWMPSWLKKLWANYFPNSIPPQFSQIKEKFGELRLYGTHSEPRIFRVLEGASYETCEYCGHPNWISNDNELGRTKGWIKTCCKQCAIKNHTIDSWTSLRDMKNEKQSFI